MLAFENKLIYLNSDFTAFIGHQFSTLCENVGEIRFSDPGREKFTARVQKFSTLSSATTARGQAVRH